MLIVSNVYVGSLLAQILNQLEIISKGTVVQRSFPELIRSIDVFGCALSVKLSALYCYFKLLLLCFHC